MFVFLKYNFYAMKDITSTFKSLKVYCESEHYKGWDPYDGLNSKVFQALPYFKKKAIWRLCMIQAFKRSPINLRRIARVPKEFNTKGIGLFLQGYCNLVNIVRNHPELTKDLGNESELLAKVSEIAELLISLQSKGDFHGACWGYNFDWQARLIFLFPKGTPTIVATNFCATALMEAYEVTKEQSYLEIALSAAEFVKEDLHRYQCEEGFLFSYSKLSGNDTVYNASLLGSRLLSYCYKYTGNEEYRKLAEASVAACCKGQREDGAWVPPCSRNLPGQSRRCAWWLPCGSRFRQDRENRVWRYPVHPKGTCSPRCHT